MAFDHNDLDDLDPDLRPSPEELAMAPSLRHPPRRDGIALGFGVAFVVFGVLGLMRTLGAPVTSAWLYPIILIGLGAAGLAGVFGREVQR